MTQTPPVCSFMRSTLLGLPGTQPVLRVEVGPHRQLLPIGAPHGDGRRSAGRQDPVIAHPSPAKVAARTKAP